MPGIGHASPIVWGDRIFTVTALPEELERALVCFARATGKILWQQTVVRGPLEKLNPENSYASGTPATDGQRVYVAFRVGDEIVVAAHDAADGKQLWLVRPGTHAGEWGFSNEPVLFKDKVIVDGDSKGKSFLIALSQDDGRTAVARGSHASRDQLQRPADPRDGRPPPVDPVRRPLRDEFRSRHGRAALDGRRSVGGVRRHAVL